MTEAEERKAFEAHMTDPSLLLRNADGDYMYMRVARLWTCWLARAALSAPAVPEDFKLVPLFWSKAPWKIEFGDGMMVADVEVTADETLTLCASKNVTALIDQMWNRRVQPDPAAPTVVGPTVVEPAPSSPQIGERNEDRA